jgi:dTDP-4-dehydrorhamnose reductase
MLGSAVYLYLRDSTRFETVATHRGLRNVPYRDELIFYDPVSDASVKGFVGRGDVVVNCIGVIKPYVEIDKEVTVYVNSLYPYQLARECRQIGARLIHISTDCVFSGNIGSYDEDAPHDALDLYGKSKSLGEPAECMVLRTSIIGREQHSRVSLVEWFLRQRGEEIRGFVNHLWNGITTREYARVIEQIVDKRLYVEGVRHVFSGTLTKYEMLTSFRRLFNHETVIHPVDAPERCDRTLTTKYADLLPKLTLRSFEDMVRDLLIPPVIEGSATKGQ